MLGWIAAAAALLLLWLFLIAPGRAGKKQRAPFERRAYAHRGLYEQDQSVPENSLCAFSRAAEAGYGVELDVQLTKDHRIVVFHDDDMKRACGLDKRVYDYTYDELQQIPLFGGPHRIPLFSDVLDVLGTRSPVIVELKYGPEWERLCADTNAMLDSFSGNACIESFHPLLVRWYKRNAPGRLRGQLSEACRYSCKYLPGWQAWIMSRLLTNVATRPQFIAYGTGEKCLSARVCEAMGAMRVLWTAREPELHARRMRENDAVIFEYYRPEPVTPSTGAAPRASSPAARP